MTTVAVQEQLTRLDREDAIENVEVAALAGELPAQLKSIQDWATRGSMGKLITSELRYFTAANFDAESEISKKTAKKELKVSEWLSGEGKHYSRWDRESTEYVAGAFRTAASLLAARINEKVQDEDWAVGDVLRRHHLFHCHLIHNPELKKIYGLFHSFEYPQDLRLTEPNFQKSKAAELVQGYELKPFKAEAQGWCTAFGGRNLIWSFSTNKIYLLGFDAVSMDYDEKLWSALVDQSVDRASAVVIDGGTLGNELFCANYFPAENVDVMWVCKESIAAQVSDKWQAGA